MTDNKYIISQNGVGLRLMTEADTDKIIGWRNSKSVMDRFIVKTPLTREIHHNWIETKIKTGMARQFIVCLSDNDTEIGSVYFRDIDNEKHTAEYGVFISEEYTGKGYGTVALKLMKDIARDDMGIKTLTARIVEGNIPSIRAFEKNGFIYDERTESFSDNGTDKKVVFMKCNL